MLETTGHSAGVWACGAPALSTSGPHGRMNITACVAQQNQKIRSNHCPRKWCSPGLTRLQLTGHHTTRPTRHTHQRTKQPAPHGPQCRVRYTPNDDANAAHVGLSTTRTGRGGAATVFVPASAGPRLCSRPRRSGPLSPPRCSSPCPPSPLLGPVWGRQAGRPGLHRPLARGR